MTAPPPIAIRLRDHPGPPYGDALEWSEAVGQERFDSCTALRRAVRGRVPVPADDIHSVAAEVAACIYFGHSFDGVAASFAEERRRGYDVAGYQVRSTGWRSGGLRINRGESAGRYLLALTCDLYPAGVVWLKGWISAQEGLRLGRWRDTGGNEPWLRVDPADLLPLNAAPASSMPR